MRAREFGVRSLTNAEIEAEIRCYERRRYNSAAAWAMRLFDLRQERKRRALLGGEGEGSLTTDFTDGTDGREAA